MNRKFIRRLKRNLLDKERLVEMLSRVVLIAASLLACLWMVSGAHASNPSIKGIKAKPLPDGSYVIDFLLSQKLGTENVSVEFERNFIQVSLKGVSAYPSRTEKINEGF